MTEHELSCGGIHGGCKTCQRVFMTLARAPGRCALCGTRHWPWEPCPTADEERQ